MAGSHRRTQAGEQDDHIHIEELAVAVMSMVRGCKRSGGKCRSGADEKENNLAAVILVKSER